MLELLQSPVPVCNRWLHWRFVSWHIILSGHSCSSGELDGLGLYGTIAVCSLGIGSGCTDGALHGACREMRKVCLLILRTMNGGASMGLGGGCMNGAFIGHSCSSDELEGLGLHGTFAVFSLEIGSGCTDQALQGACCEMRNVCLLILCTMNGASMGLGGGCMNGGAFIGSGRNSGGGGCGMDTFIVSVSTTKAIGCSLGCELHLDMV